MQRRRFSKTELRALDERIAAARTGSYEGGATILTLWNADRTPMDEHPASLPPATAALLRVAAIPSGRFLADDEAPAPADGDNPLNAPPEPPTLSEQEALSGMGLDDVKPPPPPSAAPEPPRKPKPGDPDYQRHLHDDEFRRRFGITD